MFVVINCCGILRRAPLPRRSCCQSFEDWNWDSVRILKGFLMKWKVGEDSSIHFLAFPITGGFNHAAISKPRLYFSLFLSFIHSLFRSSLLSSSLSFYPSFLSYQRSEWTALKGRTRKLRGVNDWGIPKKNPDQNI